MALCAFFVAACGSTTRMAQASSRIVPPDYVGMNAQFLLNQTAQRQFTLLQAMAAAGVETVRSDAVWAWVEPYPPVAGVHRYDWSTLDGIVAGYASRGLRWAPIVDFSVPWDRLVAGQNISPPAGLDNYVAYAAALAARYGDGGSFWSSNPTLPYVPVHSWEIWNEENSSGFWQPAPDPSRYADLYRAARRAIQAVQTRATVFVGGLVPNGADEFLAAMVAHRPDLIRQLDGVAFHPYAATADDAVALVVSLRHELVALRMPTASIAITEVGWPTAGSAWAVSDAQRAAFLSSLDDRLARSNCGVSSFSPHTLVTAEQDPSNHEDWYGLYHPDGSPSASALAYANQSIALEGRVSTTRPSGTLNLCETAVAATPPARSTPLPVAVRPSHRRRSRHRARRRLLRHSCSHTAVRCLLHGSPVRRHRVV
jgi:hypothetical protein